MCQDDIADLLWLNTTYNISGTCTSSLIDHVRKKGRHHTHGGPTGVAWVGNRHGGCFQQRLFVCLSVYLFVCLHDNFQTIKCGMMKLGGYIHSTKISPEFEFEGQRLMVKVTRDKKQQSTAFFWEQSLWARSSGSLRMVYVWENIFSIAGVAGLAVGHATTTVSK